MKTYYILFKKKKRHFSQKKHSPTNKYSCKNFLQNEDKFREVLGCCLPLHVHVCSSLFTSVSPLSSHLCCFALMAIRATTLEMVTVVPHDLSMQILSFFWRISSKRVLNIYVIHVTVGFIYIFLFCLLHVVMSKYKITWHKFCQKITC